MIDRLMVRRHMTTPWNAYPLYIYMLIDLQKHGLVVSVYLYT